MLKISCLICQINLKSTDDISVLICGHIYHLSCIETWFKLKKSCPVCRVAVNKVFVNKLFFSDLGDDYNHEVEELKCKVSQLEIEKNNLKKVLSNESIAKNNIRKDLATLINFNESINKELEEQKELCLQYKILLNDKANELELETKRCKKMTFIDNYLKGTSWEILTMIEDLLKSDDMAHNCEVLKATLIAKDKSWNELETKNLNNILKIKKLQMELNQMNNNNRSYNNELKELGNFVNRRYNQSKNVSSNDALENKENVVSILSSIELPEVTTFNNAYITLKDSESHKLIDLSIMRNVKSGESKLKSLVAANRITTKKPLTKMISKTNKVALKSYFKM